MVTHCPVTFPGSDVQVLTFLGAEEYAQKVRPFCSFIQMD